MLPYGPEDAESELREAIDHDDGEAIARLEPVIDAMLPLRSIATLHASALWYAEQGLYVFPLTPGTKVPFKGSAGLLDASMWPDLINAWWTTTPTANIGIATGHLIDVIDIDGPAGVQSWMDIADDLPEILGKVSTPRPGGNHLYIAADSGQGNRAGVLPGIDYRGIGGYVVAPPSIITGEPNPGTYTWRVPLTLARTHP